MKPQPFFEPLNIPIRFLDFFITDAEESIHHDWGVDEVGEGEGCSGCIECPVVSSKGQLCDCISSGNDAWDGYSEDCRYARREKVIEPDAKGTVRSL